MKIKYIGNKDVISLKHNKIYEARLLEKGWFGVVDESKEEYAYPPTLFEVVEY